MLHRGHLESNHGVWAWVGEVGRRASGQRTWCRAGAFYRVATCSCSVKLTERENQRAPSVPVPGGDAEIPSELVRLNGRSCALDLL